MKPTKYNYPVLIVKELKLWTSKQSPEMPDWWDALESAFSYV